MKHKVRTPFRLLLELFKARFLENDAAAPTGGYETNIYQALGFLAVPGILTTLFLLPEFARLSHRPPGPEVDWAIRAHRLFFPALSFAVTGFVTIFQWDLMFPDRRDFLILASFPIRLRELFAAKLAALGLFLLAVTAAVNFFSALMVPLVTMAVPQVGTSLTRVVAAQVAATGGASVFAFLAVAAFEGVLIALTSPRLFRRLSPLVQMFGMSLMVLCLLLYPVYSMLLRPAAETSPQWLWCFPPFWFCGLYDLLSPRPDPLFASLGLFAIKALALAAITCALAWTLGFRRHYRRTLETEDTSARAPSSSPMLRLISSPEERAILAFTGWTLARGAKHRLFLATYLSVGLSVGLLAVIAVRRGSLAISQDGLRYFPFIMAFFVVSGLRAAFQFPAELASNWLFRMTESGWGEKARAATRKRVLLSGILPALLILLPLELWSWNWQWALLHIAFQSLAGAILVELLFWTFGQIPFACSYFAGKTNLALLGVLYIVGFTTWASGMVDLEKSLEGHPGKAILAFALASLALIALWRRRPKASDLRFDAAEPHIQTLGLT